MPRPKEADRKDIRKLVLDQSKELFLKYGYDNVTMRSIAEHIGYSPAAIYLYFQNKSEIIFELYNTGFRMLYERQKKIDTFQYADPVIKLKAHGMEYVLFALENPEFYDLMFIQKVSQDRTGDFKKLAENSTDYGKLSYEFLKKNVEECQSAGFFTGHDANTVAFSIWSAVHGMVSLAIRKRIPAPEIYHKPLILSAMHFLNSLYDKAK